MNVRRRFPLLQQQIIPPDFRLIPSWKKVEKSGHADIQTAEPQTNNLEIERKERDLKQKLFSLQEPQYKELSKQSPRVGDFSPRSKTNNKNRQNRAAEKHKNRMKNSRQNKLKSQADNNSNYHAQLQRRKRQPQLVKSKDEKLAAMEIQKQSRGLEARKGAQVEQNNKKMRIKQRKNEPYREES